MADFGQPYLGINSFASVLIMTLLNCCYVVLDYSAVEIGLNYGVFRLEEFKDGVKGEYVDV
ncbi:MAG: hypothetical protein EZS28_050645, partial [Streblomastix strix]